MLVLSYEPPQWKEPGRARFGGSYEGLVHVAGCQEASCIDAIPEFKNSATEQQTVEEESMLEQMAAYEGCHSRRDMVAMQRRRQKGGRSSRSSADQSKVKNHKVYSKPTVQHTFPTFQMDMIVPRCCDPIFGTKTATWTCPRCGCTEEEHKGGMCPAQALRAHRRRQ